MKNLARCPECGRHVRTRESYGQTLFTYHKAAKGDFFACAKVGQVVPEVEALRRQR